MNGPEHYREAERLLEIAYEPTGRDVPPWVAENIAAAQAHATLALAAAVALHGREFVTRTDDQQWAKVTTSQGLTS